MKVKNTNKFIDTSIADFLRDWNPDDPEGRLFNGDGEEIVGEKKREIMNMFKQYFLSGSHIHTCKIVSLDRYKRKKEKK